VRCATLMSAAAGLLVAAGAAAGVVDPLVPHVRYLDPDARELVAIATAESPTVRRLLDAVEHSDVFVYVRMDATLTEGTANTRMLGAVPGARYVMVLVNPVGSAPDLESLLGHELQHVSEIAGDPRVRSADGLKALYARIGFAVSRTAARFETAAAIQAGRQVRFEVVRLHSEPEAET
jgi:hypothetical protein